MAYTPHSRSPHLRSSYGGSREPSGLHTRLLHDPPGDRDALVQINGPGSGKSTLINALYNMRPYVVIADLAALEKAGSGPNRGRRFMLAPTRIACFQEVASIDQAAFKKWAGEDHDTGHDVYSEASTDQATAVPLLQSNGLEEGQTFLGYSWS